MRSRTLPFLTLLAVLALPIGVAGATPPADEGDCDADDVEATYYVAGAETPVDGLGGNVVAGAQVEVVFTPDETCTYSLASFTAPRATYVEEEVELQELFDSQVIEHAEPGVEHALFVEVPDCFFQVDFAVGGVRLPPRYGPALISADNGGSHPCAAATPTPTPSPTASPTPTPTASPTPTPTASPTPAPTASPTAIPSPTATATPAPTATEVASPAATASPAASPAATATPVAVVAAQGGGSGGALADTGLSTGPLVALGALALVGGSALLWVTQRRRGGTV